MARRVNGDIIEVPVTIDEIAARIGYPYKVVREKFRDSEVFETFFHAEAVRSSRATEVLDELVAAKDAADAEFARRLNEQQDAERDARMWPVTAYELAKADGDRKARGVQAFGPDDASEPDWANE